MYISAPPAFLVLLKVGRGMGFLGTRVTDGCELPWELNLGLLQQQQVLLPTELSLYPLNETHFEFVILNKSIWLSIKGRV